VRNDPRGSFGEQLVRGGVALVSVEQLEDQLTLRGQLQTVRPEGLGELDGTAHAVNVGDA
jgi:hypothetical protein